MSIPESDELEVCAWCNSRQVLTLVGMCQACCDIGDALALDNSASIEPVSLAIPSGD